MPRSSTGEQPEGSRVREGFFSKIARFAVSKMAAFCYAVAVGVAGNLVVHYMQTHDAVPSIAATHHEAPAPADKPAAIAPAAAVVAKPAPPPAVPAKPVALPEPPTTVRSAERNRDEPAAAEACCVIEQSRAGRRAWAARRATHQRTAQHRTVEPCCRIAAARPGDRGRSAAGIARRHDRLGADLAATRDKIRTTRSCRQTAWSGQVRRSRSGQRRPLLAARVRRLRPVRPSMSFRDRPAGEARIHEHEPPENGFGLADAARPGMTIEVSCVPRGPPHDRSANAGAWLPRQGGALPPAGAARPPIARSPRSSASWRARVRRAGPPR